MVRGVVRLVDVLLLGAIWAVPARAQTIPRIAFRLASSSAVTGYELLSLVAMIQAVAEGW
ncbi:MAG TPA: hypothetical protein VE282_00890 [Gemmatimonadales bacterium]|nr:hypothetical protein [Gemmatimonadales bacterium]